MGLGFRVYGFRVWGVVIFAPHGRAAEVDKTAAKPLKRGPPRFRRTAAPCKMCVGGL